MKNLVQASPSEDGTKKLELAAPAALVSGQFALIGQFPVVAVTDLENAERGTFLVEQIISYAKESSSAVFAEGDVVFFDESANEMTDTSDTLANSVVGIAVKAAINTDTEVVFKMASRISAA